MAAAATATPDPLTPLTPAQINTQATQTVAADYAPIYAGYDLQRQQLTAIQDKRNADNKYYNDWLGAQSAKLQASSQAFQSGIASQQAQVGAEMTASFNGMAANQLAAENNRVGNVSDNSQNKQVGGLFSDTQTRNSELFNAERSGTLAQIQNQDTRLASTMANNLALAASNEARSNAQQWQALTDLATREQQARLQQVADTGKERSRLQGVSINTANANRNYALAAGRLQVGVFNAATGRQRSKEQIRKDRAAEAQAAQKFGFDQTKQSDLQGYRAASLAIRGRNAANTKTPSLKAQATQNTDYAFGQAYGALVDTYNGLVKSKQAKPFAYIKARPAAFAALLRGKLGVTQQVADAAVAEYLGQYGQLFDPTKAGSGAYKTFLSVRGK